MRFPIEYEVELRRGISSPFALHAGERPAIASGPPSEFGGSDAWWSPEHLFVSAASACFAATLSAAAARAHVQLGTLECRGKAFLDRTPTGVAFTSVHLDLRLHVLVDDVERARKLVDEAKRQCFVANSLRCPVTVSADITAS